MAPSPDVDDLLRLVKAGVDPSLGPKTRAVNTGLDAQGLVRLLAESSTDPSGEQAAAEFATAGEVATSAKRRLKKLFAKLDVDGSGSIELPEFRKLLLSSDTSLLGLPASQLTDIFEIVDSNGDEEVDYHEFLAWLGLGAGRPQVGPEAEDVPMPELDARVGGPTPQSAGSACWQQIHRLSVQKLARTLGLWNPPDGFDIRMEQSLSKTETLCLELGKLEAELRTRRMQARGAVRRWVADNFSLTSKAYMKRVEEAEKRDANVREARARMELDPEAREAAQLAGWTQAQHLGRLASVHAKHLEELENVRASIDGQTEPVMQKLLGQLPEELLATGPTDVKPLVFSQAVPAMHSSLSASLDATHVSGEGVVLCLDLHLTEVPPPRRASVPKARAQETLTLQRVDMLLVLDQSASMVEELPMLGRAIGSLCSHMNSADRLSVLGMGDEARVILDWTEMTEGGREESKACAKKLSASGGARFLPACELMLLQLRAAQASADPSEVRQPAVLFLSDGQPLEARDAILSLFSRRLASFPSLLFAPVALGPEADASLMAELGRCAHGPIFYLPDETQMDEVLGQVWATAGATVLQNCMLLVRAAPGCGILETEEPTAPCGLVRRQEEVQTTLDELRDSFRCIVVMSTESAAFKACKFAGGDGQAVYLKEPLSAGATGFLKGPSVGVGQRLLAIRRSTFLPKSKKIRDNPDLHFEGEEDVVVLDQRPPNRTLCTGVSRGTIEMEFEPPQWSQHDWVLEKDVCTAEATLCKGTRLIGYRIGDDGEAKTAEIGLTGYSDHVDGGFPAWQIQVFDGIAREARGRRLTLCFDVVCPSMLLQTGPLQRGGSRQVFARLQVPESLEKSRGQLTEMEAARKLVDVAVVAVTAEPSGPPEVIRQQLALHVCDVPSLQGKPATVRFCLESKEQTIDVASFTQDVADASNSDGTNLQVEVSKLRSSMGTGMTIFAGVSKPGALLGEKAADLDALVSAETYKGLTNRGIQFEAPPSLVGRAALRRFAQFRLSRSLRKAAEVREWPGSQEVNNLSKSELGMLLDNSDPPSSVLKSAALEAAAAQAARSHCERLGDYWHRLFGLATAHEGQHPPSVALDALGLSETEAAWERGLPPAVLKSSRNFATYACQREQVPGQVMDAAFAGSEADSVRIRFCAVDGQGLPVTAYTLSARDCETGEVYQQSSRASTAAGFTAGLHYESAIEGLPSGRAFTIVVFAWNGRRGLPSPPVYCQTPHHALHSRGPGRRPPIIVPMT